MDEIDQQRLKSAIDKVIEKFQNQDFITQDYNEYSKILRDEYFLSQILRKKKRKCSFIGCKENTIKKSHSIPKSAVLKNISYNNHLLKPEFDYNSSFPKNKMTLVGVNDASVFPGYCIKHENIFKLFEVDGKIDDEKKALLQIYRTISRDRRSREIELEISEKIGKAYKNKINQEAKESLLIHLSKYPNLCDVKNIEIEGVDSVIDLLLKQDKFLLYPNKQFELFEMNILSRFLNLPLKNDLVVRVAEIDIKFPISICGFGNQSFSNKKIKKDFLLLINVMPLQNSTFIICAGLQQNEEFLKKFFDFSFSDPLNILNLIESFMINGTDHWFINPTYWNKFSNEKQKKILFDILFTENSFVDEYKISIFDDIRIKIIETLTENIKLRREPVESEYSAVNYTTIPRQSAPLIPRQSAPLKCII